MATQEQAVDVGRNDGQRTSQFIDSGEYLILSFEDSLRIGFNAHTIRVVIANMGIEIVNQTDFCLSSSISLGIHFEKGILSGCSFRTDFFNTDRASFRNDDDAMLPDRVFSLMFSFL